MPEYKPKEGMTSIRCNIPTYLNKLLMEYSKANKIPLRQVVTVSIDEFLSTKYNIKQYQEESCQN